MDPQDDRPHRSPWRRAFAVVLRLGVGLGVVLLIGNELHGTGRSASGPLPDSAVEPAHARAAERQPPTPASVRAGFSPASAPTVLAPATPSPPERSAQGRTTAPQPNPPALHFNGRRLGLDLNAPAVLAQCQQQLGADSTRVALLGWTVPPGSKARADLAARGIEWLDFVPDLGGIARVRAAPDATPDPTLFCFQPLDASLRIQPALREPAGPNAMVPVYVHVVRDRTVTPLLNALRQARFERLVPLAVGDRTHLAGTIAAARLPEFLHLASTHPDTLWMERGRRARLLNATASRTTQSGSHSGSTPFFERGIFGVGQIIAVCDTGIDIDSCFFRGDPGWRPPVNRLDGRTVDWTARKVLAVDFLDSGDTPGNPLDWDNHGHGTAVAGTAAGSSLHAPWDPQSGNGMAPGARLIIQDAGYRPLDTCGDLPGLGCPVTNFYPALLQAVAQGATVHNHSWGEQEDAFPLNLYSQVCRELDWVTWSNKQVLVVGPAGNDAFQDTVGSPSTAKNGLSVAASLTGSSEGRIASFSSRGWASDGRIKPDLTAPGHPIQTAASDGDITTGNCYQTTRSGTSFAAPVVAGLAALVRDYFAQGFYPTGNPVVADRRPEVSAALVKAVLIHGADPMSEATEPPPSRDQGWGRVNLSQNLRLSTEAPALLALDESPGFAESPAFPFKIYLRLTATNRPLKITLVWSDYPATPGTDRHLVNDLDLRVRTPGAEWKGNRWIQGQSAPGGDYDRLNNVEQVQFRPPAPTLVEVSVWAHRIVVGPQDFSLVATGDFEVISPGDDTDADGLPDVWEQWHWGTLNGSPGDDPDGDGASNAMEFAANTYPTEADSVTRLEIGRRDSGELVLSLSAQEGRQYTLEHATGGSPQGPWTPLGAPVLIGEPVNRRTLEFGPLVPASGTGLKPGFYRVRMEGPRWEVLGYE